MTQAFTSPKLTLTESTCHGRSLVANSLIQKGELLVVWGGDVLDASSLAALPPEFRAHSVQIEENLYQVSMQPWPDADFVNHSCDPNAILRGPSSLFSRRMIEAGTEITFDYATADSSPYDEFDCACGSKICRSRVTGNDWMHPDLWRNYEGGFSPYLQQRIDALADVQGKRSRRRGKPRLARKSRP